ncbi:MAG: hypothetical protein RI556_02665 [Hydrogenovibrio sp.]|uniref:hypothetical protein n=1 Tax=Hydrogenovibrio sp. TaxID=2065821 RepID=UPI0028705640|nr:hypothetical protein [Hydrogenovibrio sp.]MDR9498052.1 hypothetical protein [Hydrogenovibrio sp.]
MAQSEVKRIAAFEFYFLDRVPTDSWELGEQYAGLHAYTLIKQLSREYARELGLDDITEEALPMMALGSDKPSSQETHVKFKRTACHCC